MSYLNQRPRSNAMQYCQNYCMQLLIVSCIHPWNCCMQCCIQYWSSRIFILLLQLCVQQVSSSIHHLQHFVIVWSKCQCSANQSNPTFKFNLLTEMWAVVCFTRYYMKCCNHVAISNERFWVILWSMLCSVSGPWYLYPRHLCQLPGLSRSLPYVYRLNLPLSRTSDQISQIKQINYTKAHKMHLSNQPHYQGLFPGLEVGYPQAREVAF